MSAVTLELLATARTMGRKAYERGDVAAPALDPHLTDLLATSLPPEVGSGAADAMRAWQDGWTAANLADEVPPTAPDAQPLALFHEPDRFGTPDLFSDWEA